jgi:hypothetical protein
MMETIRRTVPDVELRCYDLSGMSMQQQIEVVEGEPRSSSAVLRNHL